MFDHAKQYSVEQYSKMVTDRLSDIDISILINAAEVANIGLFTELSNQQVHSMLTTNCYAATLLTKELIPNFKTRFQSKKVRSLICNISSMVSYGSCSFAQTYSASKKYTDFLNEGLNYELSGYGVDVSCWRPASILTNAKDVSPDRFIEAAFAKCGSEYHHGVFKHEMAGLVLEQVSDLVSWFPSMTITKILENF